jgi:peptidoglycan/xylan/chitin deacetylase (PgdA/CDA1 family)
MSSKLLRICKETYWFFASLFFPVRNGGVILAYHSIAYNNAFFTVTPKMFEMQLQYLRRKRWNVLSLSELVSCVSEGLVIPKKTVIITFDDAYADFSENALPILEKYQIPATVFVPTAKVGSAMKNREGYELPIMNWDQLKRLSQHPLITIGSHTKNHPVLTQITDQETLEAELKESKDEIKNNLNTPCDFFAYPKGKNNTFVQERVKKHYTAAVGTRIGRVLNHNADVYHLPRKGVYEYTSFSRFKLLLKI